MDIEVKFKNEPQRQTFYATARNQCFSGGFNNGKSFIGCLKFLVLLTTFPNYRVVIARQVRADLLKTTYQTFFKLCPREIIERNNEQEGITVFKNGSTIYWLHLDKVDESTLRGLEVNAVLVDQAEEIEEKVFDVLNARVGRWDNAIIPKELLHERWPTNEHTGKLLAPSYMLLLCNPDSQYHFIYRKFHPDSLERNEKYFFVEGEWDSGLGSREAYDEAIQKDPEWVAKYVKGIWGISNAQIHRIPSSSLLDYTTELVEKIKRKGNLYRILDHGDASPTCCLWIAAISGVHVVYREYYAANKVISEHRAAINDLSTGESYSTNYADPSIFRKQSQKDGGFWSVSDEYLTNDLAGKPLAWQPADNNEYATRNRINELLRETNRTQPFLEGAASPVGFPSIYFIKRSIEYPYGCFHAISETGSQRRKIIGQIDGKTIYDDTREESVADHAYDCVRYYVAMHGSNMREPERRAPRNSFKWYKMIAKRRDAILPASV